MIIGLKRPGPLVGEYLCNGVIHVTLWVTILFKLDIKSDMLYTCETIMRMNKKNTDLFSHIFW